MTSTTPLTPLTSLRTTRYLIPAHKHIPNTTLHNRPLLIYHSAFTSPTLNASQIEKHLNQVGIMAPQWRYLMYQTSHFHSTTHELLVISSGCARLLFGGDDNPGAVIVDVQRGDAMLLPAGVAHRLLEDLSSGHGLEQSFEMVGSYPLNAEEWDMCYGDGRKGEDQEEIWGRIRKLSWLERDPIYGGEGPALQCGSPS
ncbi:hypothetical protein BKA93DRAFT_815450 [Sparassis latifolia]|uniref:Cupin type-1 domain-containing protein n=1 Tax=Sparassis crispa TaxID=139825 RepID=A0A401GM03_9APHY|nr:hypothetical protein SCP_0502650 [Sparassis crispa]GBE83218.1 hypothetical protein SCP_0502650 [Sparassis crispa]